ncbi:MAG: S41 family peptidase [SAR324 cluster bacterium]|nr:S41 family peptidase [SAR324 cluster bacterium]
MMKKILLISLLLFGGIGGLFAERFVPKSDLIPAILSIVEQGYVDGKRLVPEKMLEGSLELLSTSIAPVLTEYRIKSGKVYVTISVDQFKRELVFNKPKTVLDLNRILQDVAQFTKENLEKGEKLEKVDYALINGFLKKLDPHSMFLIPKVYSEFNQSTVGNYGGVGMMIGIRDSQLTVISPIDDTPASRAGLRAKDTIVQIDDESTVNMSLQDAVGKLKGEPGTEVKIYIMRKGMSVAKVVPVKRALIKIKSVESERFDRAEKTVGYIQVKTFGRNTIEEINAALPDLDYKFQSFQGLIIDLRNNPGGLLQQAIAVSDRFLDSGVIVATSGVDAENLHSVKANWFDTINNIPVIILINNGSASASEIVTAALKSHNRAVVLGRRTFGKGSVQQVIPIAEGAALKLTMSKYLTPGNRSIQSVGVSPHIELVPYSVEQEFVRLSPAKEEGMEKELAQAFSEWGDKPDRPEQSTFYLFDAPSDEELESEEDLTPKQARKKRQERDYLLQSAVNILFENSRKGYDNAFSNTDGQMELLKTSHRYFTKKETAQELKISKKLSEFKVDWKNTPTRGTVKLKTKTWIEIRDKSKEKKVAKVAKGEKAEKVEDKDKFFKLHKGPVPADSEIRLYLQAQNLGKKPLGKLMATTASENNALDDRQFVFGFIKPKETKKWYIPISISSSGLSRNDMIKFEFTNGTKKIRHKMSRELTIAESKRPHFLYEVSVDKDKIKVGTKVKVLVKVKNAGVGTSNKVSVLLKNGEGSRIFLRKGRQNIPKLKTGESREIAFEFDVKQAPLDGDLDLSLDILDSKFPLVGINHKLKIPMNSKFVAIKNAAPKMVMPKAKRVSAVKNYKLALTITDEGGVKDLYVIVNEKKVFYKNYLREKMRKKVDVNLELKLDEKINRIIVISRDDQNVDTKKALYVRYLGLK